MYLFYPHRRLFNCYCDKKIMYLRLRILVVRNLMSDTFGRRHNLFHYIVYIVSFLTRYIRRVFFVTRIFRPVLVYVRFVEQYSPWDDVGTCNTAQYNLQLSGLHRNEKYKRISFTELKNKLYFPAALILKNTIFLCRFRGVVAVLAYIYSKFRKTIFTQYLISDYQECILSYKIKKSV